MSYATQILRDAGIDLTQVVVVAILIFLGILIPLLAAFYLFKKRLSTRGVSFNVKWNVSDAPVDAGTMSRPPGIETPANEAAPAAPREGEETFDLRRYLKTVYKILTALIGTVLLTGAILAYQAHTPANMLLLVAGILFILALMAFLSIDKLDRYDRSAKAWGDIAQGLMKNVNIVTNFAAPSVHKMDQQTLERGLRMQSDGAPIEEICRAVSPEYDSWDASQRQAFQQILCAALKHGKK
ncbi:MAG: hypothetical protein EPN97_17185 [Alphaproteobacteria bacterium]|nr:MAG: hypothetical protein EPN97_17185 [Alphaproteobacteria bacterium]